MPDWEADSPELRANLIATLTQARDAMRARDMPTAGMMRRFHAAIMAGLTLPDPAWAGCFRGSPGAEAVRVRIAGIEGTAPAEVAAALREFEARLGRGIAALDRTLPPGQDPDADQLAAILSLCAWAHAEWVRIHPFANGNGRTARLWVNMIAMRYALPPFLTLRPRPDGDYGATAAAAMAGQWRPLVPVLRHHLLDCLAGLPDPDAPITVS